MNATAHETLLSKPGQARVVLGLDPGRHFGWACLAADPLGFVEVLDSGVCHFPKGDHDGQGFALARVWLSELYRLWTPTCVAYEMVSRHMGHNANVYCGLRGALLDAAYRQELACLPIPVGTVKKRATGSGSAKKPAMIAAVRPFLDRDPETDDEADAVFVALCGCDEAAAWRNA